jgi:hypothetical protein
VEHIYADEDGKGAVVAYRDPASPSPHGEHLLKGTCIPLGTRREMFPGVYVTIGERSTHRKVSLKIEAPETMPITMGFPHQRTPRLVHSAV